MKDKTLFIVLLVFCAMALFIISGCAGSEHKETHSENSYCIETDGKFTDVEGIRFHIKDNQVKGDNGVWTNTTFSILFEDYAKVHEGKCSGVLR